MEAVVGPSADPRLNGEPPGSEKPVTLISDQFLAKQHREDTLQRVADMAQSVRRPADVEDFMLAVFEGLEPGEPHRAIPQYEWKAIVTTNYDTLVEDSYRLARTRRQRIEPLVCDEDGIVDHINRAGVVPYLKLHGSISDRRIPLVVSTDDYVTLVKDSRSGPGRHHMFQQLTQLSELNTVLFVGHRLEDFDVRLFLRDVDVSVGQSRPQYYVVEPCPTESMEAYWGRRGTTVVKGSFGEFMEELGRRPPPDDLSVADVGPPSPGDLPPGLSFTSPSRRAPARRKL